MQGIADAKFTDTDFVTKIPTSRLLEAVQIRVNLSWRGLPQIRHLQDQSIADIFREVVKSDEISIPEENPPSNALLRCVKAGWLHNRRTASTPGMSEFTFASTWHRRYVECVLYGIEGHIEETNVVDFAMNVIMRFSPVNLVKRSIGRKTQTIPEAQYQDEFYHASLSHTKGSVMSFPEFGNKKGRIDFFIPSKRWGIELLRDGNRIGKHSERFTQGEYSRWIARGILQDYVILDFRSNNPRGNGELFISLTCLLNIVLLQMSPTSITSFLTTVGRMQEF